ncbi:MAG TPA: tRNA lysidine(34) synthetase TilS [Bacilli bacterium]|nr:tRNA lysidine(34) synthetase TilS [Bacilli bacterium]
MLINLLKNKKYLLACSYGPDSMALFKLLLNGGYDFAVAHVNYNMRGKASKEAALDLKRYTLENSIEFYELEVNGKHFTGNFQAKAREVRYSFFHKLSEKHKFAAILTGHHEDDHLETYLMQRESQKKLFYFGIRQEASYQGIKVIRPLLSFTKEEIMKFVKENDIPHEIDQTNLELNYLRNKIRHNIVNQLTKDERTKLLQELKEKNADIETMVSILSKMIVAKKVNLKKYSTLSTEKKEMLIYMLFAELDIHERYSSGTFNNIDNTINKKTASAMFKVYNNVYFVKAYQYFKLININNYNCYEITVSAPKHVKTVHFSADLTTLAAIEKFPISTYPLKITTASEDDVYEINDYKKKIKRMYVDMKMPRHLRLIWPIVKDKNGQVIFVPRYRFNYNITQKDIFIIKT